MNEISVDELARWRAEGRRFTLLDVREPSEVALAHLPDSVNIPMMEIVQRVGEIDDASEVAVLCHYGGRSERVAQFLETRGFTKVYNVAGGIDEYAERVDPAIPRY